MFAVTIFLAAAALIVVAAVMKRTDKNIASPT